MKYILWPIASILIVSALLTHGTLRLVFIPFWHFRWTSIREAYTIDGNYLFEGFTWKGFLQEIFICPDNKEEEEEE